MSGTLALKRAACLPLSPLLAACAAVGLVLGLAGQAAAQRTGPNINMVSGTTLPGGDPFLQRQNEPSVAVSTRNSCHLLAGANDYRTVDMPGLPDDKENGDAWLGLFTSSDCGRTWKSTLLPGYPQDRSSFGLASPLFGLAAGADPIVRAGTNGLFYYSGIVFNRGAKAASRVFVASFIDNNLDVDEQQRPVEPIAYVGTTVVDSGTSGQFVDKPFIATDIPRDGKTCSVGGQTLPAGKVYIAYTSFVGTMSNNTTKLLVAQSTDCGATWSKPVKISEGVHTNQGAIIGVAPNGNVYVAWRQFAFSTQPNAIMVSRSTDFGKTFSKAVKIATTAAFDQNTTTASFRTNAYPTLAIDGLNRVYVAWSARGFANERSDPATGDARIVLATSTDGVRWSSPRAVDNPPFDAAHPYAGAGHQIMPALSFSAGKLQLVYYDLRDDHSYLSYFNGAGNSQPPAAGTRVLAGDRPVHPEKVFWGQVVDVAPDGTALARRHSLDVRGAQASAGAAPVFSAWPISQYAFGITDTTIEQVQFNPPNLPLYARGTAPFLGDYIDVAGLAFVPTTGGGWAFNTDPAGLPVFHAVWTDNRDVRPPVEGKTWADYTPPTSAFTTVACEPYATGMRNSNVYTSQIVPALVVGSPANAQGLHATIPRAFPVVVANQTDQARSYRLTIGEVPQGGLASFLEATFQTGTGGNLPAVTTLDVTVAAMSTMARTAFVTSAQPDAQVTVNVQEITGPQGSVVQGGNRAVLVLNSDISNPAVMNPAVMNPAVMNQTFNPAVMNPAVMNPAVMNPAVMNPAVMNPAVMNPAVMNPAVMNPAVMNPAVMNPAVMNPAVMNPAVMNPAVMNPAVMNPAVMNSDLANASITDVTWTVKNTGTTAGTFTLKLLLRQPMPSGFVKQLIVRTAYVTPAARNDCTLGEFNQDTVLANILNPRLTLFSDLPPDSLADPMILDPAVDNVTFALAPGEEVQVTLRILDPDKSDNQTVVIAGREVSVDPSFDPTVAVVPAIVSNAVNIVGGVVPTASTPPVVAMPAPRITTEQLADPVLGQPYNSAILAIGGAGVRTFGLTAGSLPPGLSLQPDGVLQGTPRAAGTYAFTATVTESGTPPQTDARALTLRVVAIEQSSGSGPASVPFGGVGGRRLAQSFTAGAAGELTAVRLFSLSCPTPGTHLTVRVQGLVSATGFPDGTDVASGTALCSGTSAVIPLSSSVPAAPDARFAIVIEADNGSTIGAPAPPADSYKEGAAFEQFAGPWQALALANDIPFSTYSLPDNGLLYTTRALGSSAAAVLADGRVLVVSTGGLAEVFDPLTQTFTATGGMSAARYNFTTTRLLDGRVLVVGGIVGGVAVNTSEIFDPTLNGNAGGFIAGPTLVAARTMHTATLLPGGRVLVAGGGTEGPAYADVNGLELWTPGQPTFSAAGTLTAGRHGHSATMLTSGPNQGKILLAGGFSHTFPNPATAELLDPATGIGSATTGAMVSWRTQHTATVLGDGKILIAGGSTSSGAMANPAELYDPSSDTFGATGALATPRVFHTAEPLPDGSVLIAGGFTDTGSFTPATPPLTSLERYDPVSGTFSSAGSLLVRRRDHASASIAGGAVLLTGGTTGSQLAGRSAELFDPLTPRLVLTTAIPDGHVGQLYPATTLVASGGTAPYVFRIVSGSLPSGLTLAGGLIQGTPASGSEGPWSFTLEVQDSAGPAHVLRQGITIRIDPLVISLASTTLPTAYLGQPYSFQFVATGHGAITWSAPTGVWSPSLSLDSSGLLSGVPTWLGSGGVAVVATDAIGQVASVYVDLTVVTPPTAAALSFIEQPPASIAADAAFSVRVRAVDGGGNPVVGALVALDLAPHIGGASVPSGPVATDASGEALFSNAKINRGGYDYRLVASNGPVSSSPSTPVDVAGFAIPTAASAARVRPAVATLADGRVLMAGGSAGPATLASAEIYDPATHNVLPTGSMNYARQGASATLLPNGTVLIAGGTDSSGVPTSLCELFDPVLGTFSYTGSLSAMRTSHSALLLPDGRVFVVGGKSANSRGELYNPVTGTFSDTTGSSVYPPREYGQSATLLGNGKVLIAGGNNPSGTSSAELFDPGTEQFTPTGAMPQPRSSHAAVRLPNGSVLVAGGMDGAAYLDTAVIYDVAGGLWTSAASTMPGGARSSPAAVVLPSGKALVAGGSDASQGFKVADLYDPATGLFAATGPMVPPGRSDGHQLVTLNNGLVLAIGGDLGIAGTAEVYYPIDPPYPTAGFEPGPTLATARRQHTATRLADGKVLVAGGYDNSGAALNTAELCDAVAGACAALVNTMTSVRARHTATLLPSGKVLLVGGWIDGTSQTVTAELYDPATRSFTATGSMAGPRISHTATLLPSGDVLVLGGNGIGKGEIWTGGTFSQTAGSFAISVSGYVTSTLLPNGNVWFSGGPPGSGDIYTGFYDWAMDSFSLGPTLGFRSTADGQTSTLLGDGRALVAGGWGVAAAVIYDPATGVRTKTAGDMNVTRCDPTATVLPNGQVLFTGGTTAPGGTTTVTQIELFDPATGLFTVVGSMAASRWGHSATMLGATGKVLIIGGSSGAGSLSTTERYRSR
jgi:hypothetical protein